MLKFIPLKGFLELVDEFLKQMDWIRWKSVAQMLDTTFKHEGEKYTNNIFKINSIIVIK